MFNGVIEYSRQSQFLFELGLQMEGFIHFYQFVDAKIASERLEVESEVVAEEGINGEFMGYSGPINELEKLSFAPRILYHSIFISLYSFLELKLTTLIDEFASHHQDTKIRHSDLKGNDDIQRIQKYLEKALSLDLSDMKIIFEDMQGYRKIRNAFVHNGGCVSKNKDGNDFIQMIQKNLSLHLNLQKIDSGYLSIRNSTFILEFCRFIPLLLGQIFNKIYPENSPITKVPENE